MKKILLAGVIASGVLLTGCATGPYQGGLLFTDLQAPAGVTESKAACAKKGTSKTVNVLGLVGLGDGSIDAAKKQGAVVEVSSVDYRYTSILGLYSSTMTTVCGK